MGIGVRPGVAVSRHEPVGDSSSSVAYKYNFSSSPRWLGFIIDPVVQWIFHRETARRLIALKAFLESDR